MTTRVGLVGCGAWGSNVLRDLVALGTQVIVAERDADRRDRAITAGASRGVASAAELPECDGYVVVTPAPTHREVCEYLLSRGVPVFVEKPPCNDVADVEALARISGDRLFVMHKWRYHPGIRSLAEIAKSGRLGTRLSLETIRTGPEVLPPDVDVLWHLGPHDLSIAVEILGAVVPVREARGARASDGRITQCQVRMATDAGAEHRMTLAMGVPDRVRRVTVSGADGIAVLEQPDSPTVAVSRADGTDVVAIAMTMPLADELRVFVEHLEGGPPPVSGMATALEIAQRLSEVQQAVDSTQR